MSEKPWNGRFSEKTHKLVEAFTSSIDVDKRLYPYDIKGSIAHCRMLAKQGIITDDEASQIVDALAESAFASPRQDVVHRIFSEYVATKPVD